MPVTKKKGTIFAIYTDSPLQPTASSSTSHPSHAPSPSTNKPRTLPPRKALASIQPKSHKPKGFPSAPLSTRHDPQPTPTDKENSITTNPKPSTSLKGKSSLPPIQTSHPPKRQLDVFSSPANSPTTHSHTHTHITQPHQATSTSTYTTTTLLSTTTPSKKLKITPPKAAVSTREKENIPPQNDDGSPATRTRSKSRTSTTTTTVTVLVSPSVGTRTRREVEGLLGDGRGTLTLKKGRAVAGLMKGKGSIRVLPDEVLGDVSDIYGASGEEPEGFRTGLRTK